MEHLFYLKCDAAAALSFYVVRRKIKRHKSCRTYMCVFVCRSSRRISVNVNAAQSQANTKTKWQHTHTYMLYTHVMLLL